MPGPRRQPAPGRCATVRTHDSTWSPSQLGVYDHITDINHDVSPTRPADLRIKNGTTVRILVRVVSPPVVFEELKGSKPGPGHRFVFSEDLELVEYDGIAQKNRLVGSHSGFVTTLRIAGKRDKIYPKGSILMQYEGIYRFQSTLSTPVQKGQVIARGVLYGNFDRDGIFAPLDGPVKLAITGGTDVYQTARGQIIERDPLPENRLLDIQL